MFVRDFNRTMAKLAHYLRAFEPTISDDAVFYVQLHVAQAMWCVSPHAAEHATRGA
jgi:hypothetical protein